MTKPSRNRLSVEQGADAGALILVLVMMALSWYLVNGVATAVYDQYEPYGDPPKSLGPAGGIEGSQQGHSAYFWSERAFHYRTTLMFALDDYDDTATLSRDTSQQYPNGVNAWAEYTLMMEPVYGKLYRWFGRANEPLVEFLLRLIPLVHVLLFLPIFWLARSMGARPWLALAAVLIYATCSLGFTRLAGSLLFKETFSLLWLMIFLAAHFHACRQRNFVLLLVAALALILSLASWHLSQFLLLVVFLAAGATAETKTEVHRGFWPGPWWPAAVYLVAGVLAGLTPSLWSRGFFLSMPMAALGAWFISSWWACRQPDARFSRLSIWFLSLIILATVSFLNPLVEGDYNHVSGLLFQKIAHGFVLPENPSSLPFDVRVFWAPPFNSPTMADIIPRLGYHLLLLLSAGAFLLSAAVRRKFSSHASAFLLVVLGYLAAWLLIERLGIVFWPVAVVAIVMAAEKLLGEDGLPRRLKPSLALGLLIAVTTFLNLTETLKPEIQMARLAHAGAPIHMGISDADTAPFKVELFDYLRRETTGPGSSVPGPIAGGVLGDFAVSPQVLLYARRPGVLNSQFENTTIRERYHHYLELLFGTDDGDFLKFLRETRTAYLFINRNWATTTGPGSVSWQAGVNQDLTMDMLMLRLHFNPESFSFLKPVFENEYYRIFRVGETASEQPQNLVWQGRRSAWWDKKNFTIKDGRLVNPKVDCTRILEAEKHLSDLLEQFQLIMDSINRRATSSSPPLMYLQQQRLQLLMKVYAAGENTRNPQNTALVSGITKNLNRIQPRESVTVGVLLENLLQGQAGKKGMLQLLKDEPAGPVNYASAGQVLGMLSQYEKAAVYLEKAASFFPLKPLRRAHDGRPVSLAPPMASQLRQECVWWYIGAERFEYAADLAAGFLPYEKPGSRQAVMYMELIEAVKKNKQQPKNEK